MPKPHAAARRHPMHSDKPTGAQLYRKWGPRGWALSSLSLVHKMDAFDIENLIRAYLVARDKRRKRCPRIR